MIIRAHVFSALWGLAGEISCFTYQYAALSQVSVGRLGLITELDFRILPQAVVQRQHMTLSFDQFVAEIKIVQDTYNMAKSAGLDTWPALSFLNEVQVISRLDPL
jgi:hypothetical protein